MSEARSPAAIVGFFDTPLGAVADAARVAIVMADAQQTIVALNAAGAVMFGVSSSEILGQPLSRLIPDRYRARHTELFREFDASGAVEPRRIRRDPVLALRANGQEFPAEVSISRVELLADGAPHPYFVAVLRDLSVERGLSAEVDALTRRLRSVLDLAPVAMWITEGEHVSFANRAARELLGLREGEDLIGESVYALLDPNAHAAVRAHLAQALSGGPRPQVLSGRLRRRDGQTREVEIVSAPLPDHGRTVVQMVITDITERQLQLREHHRHRAELRRLAASVVDAREEERRRIARELHDELGQRLTALKMDLASLRPPGAKLCDEQRLRGVLEMIDDTVAAVRRIAADLRPLMLDDLGLNAAIESLARDAAQRMGMGVTVRLGEEDPPLTDSAAIALYRMVQEALTNVSRHARATDVHIELQAQADAMVLTVRDNGVGFSGQALQHEGRYGLLGIRERALALGGELTVDNPPDGGGRITVRLPIQQPHLGAEDPA